MCGHRKTLKVDVPLHFVAPDEKQVRYPVALTISSRSVRRRSIAHSDLLFHPCKLHIVQELSDRDFASGSALCEQLVTLVNEHPVT